MNLSLKAATRALRAYVATNYDPVDVVELRLLPTGRSGWLRAFELPTVSDGLLTANARGENIYAGINPRVAHGRRGDASVACCRALFADFDNATLEQVAAAMVAAGMPLPTLLVMSGHGWHLYWRLLRAIDPASWREWQQDLAALLGSDPSVFNAERISRLPGFLNVKRKPAVPCRVHEYHPDHVYDLADLPIPLRAGSDTPAPSLRLSQFFNLGDAAATDRVSRCRFYIQKCPPAVSGEHGHRATWYVANTCNRFGLTRDEAVAVLREYSTRCSPPWSEDEIQHKVADAYGRNASQHGDKLRDDPGIPGSSSGTLVIASRRTAGAA